MKRQRKESVLEADIGETIRAFETLFETLFEDGSVEDLVGLRPEKVEQHDTFIESRDHEIR